MNPKLQRSLPIILSIAASFGVVGTSYLTARANRPKESNKDNIKLSKKEMLINFLKKYKWPMLTGAATIASILTGTIISKKIEASLTATTILLDTALHKYKDKANEILGPKAKEIVEKVAEDDYKKIQEKHNNAYIPARRKQLYRIEPIGFFEAYPDSIVKGLITTNERIWEDFDSTKTKTVTDQWASLKTFLEDSHAVMINEMGVEVDELSFDWGWSREQMCCGGDYGDNVNFLKLIRHPHKNEEGKIDYILLEFSMPPFFGVSSNFLGFQDKEKLLQYNNQNNIDDGYCTNDLETSEAIVDYLTEQK